MNCLIIGCGYLGSRVADRWLRSGNEVTALTRSSEKAKRFREQGIVPIVADVTDAASLRNLPSADVVLYAVAYDSSSGDRSTVTVGGLQNFLAAASGRCARIVFVSTSSVYGQSAGEWVDEESETRPITEAGQIALEAERVLREHREFQSVILRLTGLYGPDRLLRRVDQLRSGEPIAGNGNAWLNLIHVDDAAGAVLSAADRLMRGALKPKTYLVSDDRPVARCEYFEQLSQLTGTLPPRFDPSAPSRITGVGKRCRNHAAKRELGLSLAFPTYADGLEDAWTRSTQRT